jgi:hypothetical protein
MRATTFVVALLLAICTPAAAQEEWIEYQNPADGFKVDFPGQPKVTDTSWTTEQGFIVPARVYSAERGAGRYSLTVVDYTVIERLGDERSQACPGGAETCQGYPAGIYRKNVGPAYSVHDLRGALLYGSFTLLQRDARVTAFQSNFQDLVEGIEIHLTNADQSRTQAFISMHENKLYVLEGTVPKGYPEPGLFQQSLGYVDRNGKGIRYLDVYSNQFHGTRVYPPPPLQDLGALLDPANAARPASGGR